MLEAPTDSKISAVFRDIDGNEKTVELIANGSRNRDAAPFTLGGASISACWTAASRMSR